MIQCKALADFNASASFAKIEMLNQIHPFSALVLSKDGREKGSAVLLVKKNNQWRFSFPFMGSKFVM